MPSASRRRELDELEFIDVASHKDGPKHAAPEPGTSVTSREIEEVVFPKKDYEDIAKELGCKRNQVSFVVHAIPDKRGRVDVYELTGTYGEGENYDPSQDPRAAFRMTQDLLRQGAGAVAAANEKK